MTLAVLFSSAGALGSEDMLDRRSYAITLQTTGSQKPTQDVLIFQNKKFETTLSKKEGFPPVGYQAVSQGGVVTFSAQTESPDNVLREWTGVVRASQIEGSMTETRTVIRTDKKSKDLKDLAPKMESVKQTYRYRGSKK